MYGELGMIPMHSSSVARRGRRVGQSSGELTPKPTEGVCGLSCSSSNHLVCEVRTIQYLQQMHRPGYITIYLHAKAPRQFKEPFLTAVRVQPFMDRFEHNFFWVRFHIYSVIKPM
jgi:hypothetical protein